MTVKRKDTHLCVMPGCTVEHHVTEIYCDICGTLIDEDSTWDLSIIYTGKHLDDIDYRMTKGLRDVCTDCIAAIEETVNERRGKGMAREDDPDAAVWEHPDLRRTDD